MKSLLLFDWLLQVSGITPDRAAALIPVVLGLISVIVGRMALTRSADRVQFAKGRSVLALTLGFIGIVLSAWHLVRVTGAIGSGSGKLGAMVALVLGLIGVTFGALALARVRRITRRSSDVPLK